MGSKNKAEQKSDKSVKIIAINRKASHSYHLMERFEAGIVLLGSEVKSLRDGKINLKDGFARLKNGELWLENVHISEYPMANIQNHDPTRSRKLLLNRSELDKLAGNTTEKGLTIVPTRIYFKKGRAKIEVALAKGKKLYDKREDMRKKESRKVISRAMISRS